MSKFVHLKQFLTIQPTLPATATNERANKQTTDKSTILMTNSRTKWKSPMAKFQTSVLSRLLLLSLFPHTQFRSQFLISNALAWKIKLILTAHKMNADLICCTHLPRWDEEWPASQHGCLRISSFFRFTLELVLSSFFFFRI